jgi:hypothetical protein
MVNSITPFGNAKIAVYNLIRISGIALLKMVKVVLNILENKKCYGLATIIIKKENRSL